MAEQPKQADRQPNADAIRRGDEKDGDRTVALSDGTAARAPAAPPAGSGNDETVAFAPAAPAPADTQAAGAPGTEPTPVLQPAPASPQPLPEGESPAAQPGASTPPVQQPTAAAYRADDELTVVEAPEATGAVDAPTLLLPARHGRPRLILQGPGGDRTFLLTKPDITVGRSASCDIVLAAPTVSRLHAKVSQQGSECLFTPVGSHRNTYVNDELVTRPIILHDGDRIQISSEQLRYKVAEDAPRVTRRAALGAGAAAVLIAAALVVFYATRPEPPVASPPPPAPPIAPSQAAPPAPSQAAPAAADTGAQAADSGVQKPAPAAAEDAAAERQRAEEQARRERISRLLYAGDVAFLERRYTSPVDGSAVYAYSEVLKVDPGNARALAQTGEIIDMYLGWAERAQADGQSARARLYRDKAAYVHEQVPAAGDVARIDTRLKALGSE